MFPIVETFVVRIIYVMTQDGSWFTVEIVTEVVVR